MENGNGISENDPQRDIYICMEGPVLTAYQSSHLKRERTFCLQIVACPQCKALVFIAVIIIIFIVTIGH